MPTPKTRPALPAALSEPYIGWLDHYRLGYQLALVRLRDGRRVALRLGGEAPLGHVRHAAEALAEITGLPVVGELSKRGFLPLADVPSETGEGGVASC
ncbi:hypothetical protein [Streptosporangium jomthongense]|uniref:Uncharacterized protein n=1 Tax=Streptosporangium jomthongense TaxID=1193683 RepID=A0ABV8F4S3_9ACTN